jgi:hypothetical protein
MGLMEPPPRKRQRRIRAGGRPHMPHACYASAQSAHNPHSPQNAQSTQNAQSADIAQSTQDARGATSPPYHLRPDPLVEPEEALAQRQRAAA